jgi:DNA-binding GntR family transcriptional regulator
MKDSTIRPGRRDVSARAQKVGTEPGRLPLYIKVAHALQHQIGAGEYPIGSLLPTEIELAKRHGVSRQTIRQAVQQLRQQKLLSAKKGVGTRVETRHPRQAYYFALQSLTQIFQFASEAALHVHQERMLRASGALANKLACRPGHHWLHVGGTRQVAGDPVPICWTEAYIDGRYASLLRGTRIHQSAIFSVIERHSGEAVTEVEQEINATVLDRNLATRLLAAEGSPALAITRRYFGAGHRLIEMSINVHPSDRFSYAISLKRDLP